MGRDARVGYAHNHRHMEACVDQPAAEEAPALGTHDRHDKRTSTHKTAGEKDHLRRPRDFRESGPRDGSLSKDEGGAPRNEGRIRDEGRIRGDDLRAGDDDAGATETDRPGTLRERTRCTSGAQAPRRECVDEAPAPYRRDAYRPSPSQEDAYRQSYQHDTHDSYRDERRESEPRDELARPVCGVLCMLRRAKFGYCGAGCSYYRQRYEDDGYGGFYRRHRHHHSGEDYRTPEEPEPLK